MAAAEGLNGTAHENARDLDVPPPHLDDAESPESEPETAQSAEVVVEAAAAEPEDRISIDFPSDLDPLPQVLLYDDDANGYRPVRAAGLDVRDLGGGVIVVIGKVLEPIRVRRVPDGVIVEVPARSFVAFPIVSDLIQVPAEMAKFPEKVLEFWFWPIPDSRRELAPGVFIMRYAVRGGWIEGVTKQELMA